MRSRLVVERKCVGGRSRSSGSINNRAGSRWRSVHSTASCWGRGELTGIHAVLVVYGRLRPLRNAVGDEGVGPAAMQLIRSV